MLVQRGRWWKTQKEELPSSQLPSSDWSPRHDRHGGRLQGKWRGSPIHGTRLLSVWPHSMEVSPKGCVQSVVIVDEGEEVGIDLQVFQADAEFELKAARCFQQKVGLAALQKFALNAGVGMPGIVP